MYPSQYSATHLYLRLKGAGYLIRPASPCTERVRPSASDLAAHESRAWHPVAVYDGWYFLRRCACGGSRSYTLLMLACTRARLRQAHPSQAARRFAKDDLVALRNHVQLRAQRVDQEGSQNATQQCMTDWDEEDVARRHIR